jgi:hypothetical protein
MAHEAPIVDTDHAQRWREGRAYYQERGRAFVAERYGVELLPGRKTAAAFVRTHHYLRSFVASRVCVGLYESRGPFFAPELVGVAAFSVPGSQASLPRWAPGLTADDGVNLGRFVLLDHVPYSAETWFLTRAFRVLRAVLPEIWVVLSYSDPLARNDEDGRVLTPGHFGAIYQRKEALHLGRTEPHYCHFDARGCMVDDRSLSKVRALDRDDKRKSKGGAAYARHLITRGAPARRFLESHTDWVKRALDEGPFHKVKHPGNFVYLFGADGTGTIEEAALLKQGARKIPAGVLLPGPTRLPYPTRADLVAA